MRRKGLGETRRMRVFEAQSVNVPAETRACPDQQPIPNAISVFIISFSDVP